MTALTSLARHSTTDSYLIHPFFIAMSEVEPLISHAEALVDILDDSNLEKPYFRAMVGLAKATSFQYQRRQHRQNCTADIGPYVPPCTTAIQHEQAGSSELLMSTSDTPW